MTGSGIVVPSAAELAGLHLNRLFPDTGPLRRELYVKHLEHFRAGAIHDERWLMAANRVGKSWSAGAYEVTLHMTGLYPSWWEGKRFDGPVRVWVAGETGEKTRDAPQAKLTGRLVPEAGKDAMSGRDDLFGLGNGMIPGYLIAHHDRSQRVKGAIEQVWVRHVPSGGLSTAQFKSFEQGPEAFASNEIEIMWHDEEPPIDVYTESIIRLMTTEGIAIITATPLKGYTELVVGFVGENTMVEGME